MLLYKKSQGKIAVSLTGRLKKVDVCLHRAACEELCDTNGAISGIKICMQCLEAAAVKEKSVQCYIHYLIP